MQNVLGCVLMAAITLPVSYLLARGFLDGIVRFLNSGVENKRLGS